MCKQGPRSKILSGGGLKREWGFFWGGGMLPWEN